jgi:anti-sigma B factor antagonist
MILELKEEKRPDGITILELIGRLTLGNVLMDAEHKVKAMIQGGARKMILDLNKLSGLDSAGIGFLVYVSGEMERSGGRLCVIGANERVTQIFAITHIDKVVLIEQSRESAIQALSASSASA